MNNETEAFRLATYLDDLAEIYTDYGDTGAAIENKLAAAELRRLTEANQELVQALEEIHEEPFDGNDVRRIARVALAKAKGESDETP